MRAVRIAGTGVPALTLALALCRSGLQNVELFAAATEPAKDPGLSLSPNATRVLNALGLGQALDTHSVEPSLMVERAWRSGYLLTQRPLGKFARQRYGAPHMVIPEPVLEDIMRAELQAYDVGFSAGDALGRDLPGGSPVAGAHIVVGCDGPQSRVRQAMGYSTDPLVSDYSLWRARADKAVAGRSLDTNAVVSWVGPRQAFGHWPGAAAGCLELLAIFPNASGRVDQAFANWHPSVRALIDRSQGQHSQPLTETPPISQWYHEDWVLLGDACQLVHPYLQQGTAVAIEDAWVLARMLDRWEEEVTSAFRDYERYRKVRVNRLRAETRSRWEQATLAAGIGAQRRNVKLSLMSRFLPEMAMAQLDWLYGYDCIKGFE